MYQYWPRRECFVFFPILAAIRKSKRHLKSFSVFGINNYSTKTNVQTKYFRDSVNILMDVPYIRILLEIVLRKIGWGGPQTAQTKIISYNRLITLLFEVIYVARAIIIFYSRRIVLILLFRSVIHNRCPFFVFLENIQKQCVRFVCSRHDIRYNNMILKKKNSGKRSFSRKQVRILCFYFRGFPE